jgi:hypothetical protein
MIEEFTKTDFGVHKSLRYHAKRRAFFDGLHRFSMAVIAITGSAAFLTLIGGDASVYGKIAATIAAFASAFELTLSLPERARDHGALYERFSNLAVKLAELDPNALDPAAVRKLMAERLTIEASEPIALTALNILCHNEEAEARGYDDRIYKIGWFQRIVIQLGTLPWFKITQVAPAQAVL